MSHEVLYTAEQIREKVEQLAASLDAAGLDSYLVLTVLKGAAIFSADLVRAMRTPTQLEYMVASSYLEDFTPGEKLTVDALGGPEVRDRHVLIVEDIVDTGRTLEALHHAVAVQGPKSVTSVALVDKTSRRETAYRPTHSGFHIAGELIYGYGLDWNQQYRGLPYLAVVDPPPT